MDKIEEILTRGVEKIYPSKEALENVLRSGKKIRVYQGFDPSMPNLHLGNMVGILKLKQFQDLGHEIIFLVGDFTGMIGDPTDKSSARKRLTRKQTLKNAKNWRQQAGKILNFRGKNPAKMLFNSSWLDKMEFEEFIEICSKFSTQQIIERDFFQKRIKEGKPIFLHEFLYPVFQAIDCVKMDVDLEIGGTDQTFNMLAGRTLMKALKNKEKFVLTTKLLVDAREEKVGKTTGNALFLNSSAIEMYGKIMSFPDEVIPLAFELLTLVPLQSIKSLKKKLSPMDLKKRLAFEIVKMYHSEKAAKNAEKEFERVFQKGKSPIHHILIYDIKREMAKKANITEILTKSKLIPSRSEAKRLILQGGVDINQSPITNYQSLITLKEGDIIRVGKRKFIKIHLV